MGMMSKRVFVSSIFRFEAAHKLPNYVGKCADLHGHTYRMRVTCSGAAIDASGIVIDFGRIKEVANELIVQKYDHKYLNDFFEMPSAEVMCIAFFDILDEAFTARYPGIRLDIVRLYEGGSESYAEVQRNG